MERKHLLLQLDLKTDLEVVGETQLHDLEVVAVLGEYGSDGVADRALLGDGHDLGHLVGQVDLKHVPLVFLEDVQVLCGGREREERM